MTFHETPRGRSAPSPGNALKKAAMMPWHRGVAAPRHHDVTVPITAPVEMW